MEYVSNLLQQSPDQFATLITLKEQLVSISLSVCWSVHVHLFICDNSCVFLQKVDECTFKRIFQYMRAAKLVEYCQFPLEDLDPSAGPCTTKRGNVPFISRTTEHVSTYSNTFTVFFGFIIYFSDGYGKQFLI